MALYHKSTTTYTDRTVDLLLLQFVRSPVADAEVKPDVSVSPRIVTGIEKLVQRYAQLFLTQVGTVVNAETQGTGFMSALGTGHIYDLGTLTSYASAANKDVQTQIIVEDRALDTPDDEALANSEVIDLGMDRPTATVTVTVKLTTKAGDTYVYVTPIAMGL